MKQAPRRLTVVLWLGALLACLLQISQTRFVSDLSAFMPKLPTERQQLLVDQLRDGVVARLIIVGIEGGDDVSRASTSNDLAAVLRANPVFLSVQNGDLATLERDKAYFFDNRYLLSPAVNRDRFSAEGMKKAIEKSLDALTGNAGLLLKNLLARDPTGETRQIVEQFAENSQPQTANGVWVSQDGKRAILLVQIRGSGTDTDAQASAISFIRNAFKRVSKENTNIRLLMSGTSVLSVASRGIIESEIARLAFAGTAFVVVLLLFVYRSITLLVLGLLPVVSGALVGIAAVSLVFGHVHGLTLAFGSTLIGEAVDYSIYFFVQRAGGVEPSRFWRTIRLGVLTSVTGFAALVFSGFPGLSQLGVYSISGLISAALVTRYGVAVLMPPGLSPRDLTKYGAWLELGIAFLTRHRWVVMVFPLIAVGVVATHSGGVWNKQLNALSPVSASEQQLDQLLRSDLGNPDLRYIASVTAADEQSALRAAERVGAVLQEQVALHALSGFNSPSLVLPSIEVQQDRQASLPDQPLADHRMREAVSDLPLKAERLTGFVQDLSAARTHPPLTRHDLVGTSMGVLVDSLLVKRAQDYLVLMPLRPLEEGTVAGEIDLSRLTGALDQAGVAGVTVIDLLEETSRLFNSYLQEAVVLSGLGVLGISILLLAMLKSVVRTLNVLIPLGSSVVCITAAILASGTQLTILHLIGLLLVVAVGSNYALFFDRNSQPASQVDQRQLLVSLIIANLTTVGSFGLLGLSRVPVLSAIGITVGPGAFMALVFSAILSQRTENAAQA